MTSAMEPPRAASAYGGGTVHLSAVFFPFGAEKIFFWLDRAKKNRREPARVL